MIPAKAAGIPRSNVDVTCCSACATVRWSSLRLSKISPLSSSSQSQALKLSQHPFSQCEPGSIYVALGPMVCIQSLDASATNSGPLSERMNARTPWMVNRSVTTSTKRVEFNRRLTRIVRCDCWYFPSKANDRTRPLGTLLLMYDTVRVRRN